MTKELNWEARNYWKLGPNFGLEVKNPRNGMDGTDVYTFYATTENGDQHSFGLSDGSGLFKIYNDRSIEIVAGQTNGKGVDIVIIGKNGDVTITAERDGNVRIRAKNITIDADENVNISAGKNVNINSAKRCVIQTNQADIIAKTGNAAPDGTSAGQRIYGPEAKAGVDKVADGFFAGSEKKYIG